MSNKRNTGSAIILTVAATQFGPTVVAAEDTPQTTTHDNDDTGFQGLVASDDYLSGLHERNRIQASEEIDLSGSSGCFEGGVDDDGVPILPDLSTQVALSPDREYRIDEVFQVNVTVSNTGRDCAPGTLLSFEAPLQVEFLGATGCIENRGEIPFCVLGDIDENTSSTITLDFRAVLPGIDAPLTATASNEEAEESLINNQGTALINVAGAAVPALSSLGKWLMALLLPLMAVLGLRRRNSSQQ